MSALDVVAISLYAVLVLWIGVRAGRRHGSAVELQLGGRRLSTGSVACSMVATELSAATFIGVPHAAYTGSWSYLQLAFGALLGKWLLARHVIPLYHRARIVTVYGFLAGRFGERTRRAAALCFVGGRTLASGVRLFIAALAFSVAAGWPLEAAVVVCGTIAGLYTLAGGIRSVVFTDALQALVFALGAAALLAALYGSPGQLDAVLAWAERDSRTRVFHTDPWLAWDDARPLAVSVLGAFFLTLATHATDHDMVQRLLSTRDGRAGGRALLASALLNFPLTLAFLAIGTGLAFHYSTSPAYDVGDGARALPLFALHELSGGLRGLVFAGLFAAAMSSLDSAICALATTWVVDIRPGAADDAALARRTRTACAAFCVLLVGAALGMAAYHRALPDAGGGGTGFSLVDLALSSMTILYGGLLGVFGLGLATRRFGGDRSALAGLAVGALAGAMLFLHPIVLGRTVVAWPWWIPLSAGLTAAVAALGRPRSPSAECGGGGNESEEGDGGEEGGAGDDGAPGPTPRPRCAASSTQRRAPPRSRS
jgi:SSS family solute:Na+ symporter